LRVSTRTSGQRIELGLRLDLEDDLDGAGQQGMPIELVTDSATIQFEMKVGEPHPDLVALAVLAIVAPWCRRRLTIDRGISPEFARTAFESLGIQIGPIDETLPSRPPGQRLGLMYSGGPDCMAAQVLLDMPMPLFHFRRVGHPRVPNRATGLKGDVQEAIVRQVQSSGEELHVARSNLEYLCKPFPTFPHWVALTVGAVVLAGHLDLGGVVTGRNISGIYLGWGRGFTPGGEQESQWEALFAAVGLRLIHPLAGASDILSKRISRGHPHYDLARSCVAGTLEGPCLRCKKCLITELMSAAAQGAALTDEVVASLTSNHQLVRSFDHPPPYPNQHLLAYSLARIPNIGSTFLATAKETLAPTVDNTAWMDRYYRPALSQRLSPEIAARVASRLEDHHAHYMSSMDESIVNRWSATD